MRDTALVPCRGPWCPGGLENWLPLPCVLRYHALRFRGSASRLTQKIRNPQCIHSLYCAIIGARLTFCTVIWDNLPVFASDSTENVHRRFARIVYNRYIGRRHFYTYHSISSNLSLVSLRGRRKVRNMNFLQNAASGSIYRDELLTSIQFQVPSGKASKFVRLILWHSIALSNDTFTAYLKFHVCCKWHFLMACCNYAIYSSRYSCFHSLKAPPASCFDE